MAERLPLAGVAHALVDAALGQADRQRGDRHPALVQDLEELGVAPALRPSRLAAGTRQSAKDSSRVSDAHQPTFEYFGATVNPAVPAGTTIAEISGRRPSGRR